MPLPKRQHSKQRGRKRRTHWKTRVASLSVCSQCQKPIIPHRICPFCGYYRGSQIVTAKVKASKTQN
jgi:large subunit ribosomal protein L32